MRWAKFPSRWIKGYAAGKAPSDAIEIEGGLQRLRWAQHQSTATYALYVLVALCVLANEQQRARPAERALGWVAATYDRLEAVTLLSRSSIANGLSLLAELGIVRAEDEGRAKVYELPGIDTPGNWCMLPEEFLLKRSDSLRRLDFVRKQARSKATLHALKIYLVLLAFRDARSVTSLSYEKIVGYTGVRREEIRAAISLLIVNGLCSLAPDIEQPTVSQHRHNRYRIRGFHSTDVLEKNEDDQPSTTSASVLLKPA